MLGSAAMAEGALLVTGTFVNWGTVNSALLSTESEPDLIVQLGEKVGDKLYVTEIRNTGIEVYGPNGASFIPVGGAVRVEQSQMRAAKPTIDRLNLPSEFELTMDEAYRKLQKIRGLLGRLVVKRRAKNEENQIRIEQVTYGLIAEIGIEKGDTILAVGGVKPWDFRGEYLEDSIEDGNLQVSLLRGGKPHTIELSLF